MDNPPVSPDVVFYPYRAIADELLVSISPNTGLYKNLAPIPILEMDNDQIQKHYIAQKRTEDEGLEYSNDDYVEEIHMFETDVLPNSYADMSFVSTQKVGAFELSMVPNEYKYVAFRSVDKHKNFSNPTPVYSLRIITLNENIASSDQASYLEVNAVVPSSITSPLPEKSGVFKKFLKIKPSFVQEKIDNELNLKLTTAIGEMPLLGELLDESVIESMKIIDAKKGVVNQPKKKYKLRIKSTTTGRVIDINFAFRIKKKPITAIDFENI